MEASYLKEEFKMYDSAETTIREIEGGDSKEWHTILDSSNTKLKYKQEEGKNSYTFYAERTMELPWFNVARMFMTYPTW